MALELIEDGGCGIAGEPVAATGLESIYGS
jgi:hypothetical protein